MELNAKEVLEVLRAKGARYLYHANTVQTSCTFLRRGRLLARGIVSEQQLPQTPQQSDSIDRATGLWFDIFLDAVDIHYRSGGRNFYGPVLFQLDLDLLREAWLPTLWITRKNPQDWSVNDSLTDRYFTSVAELKKGYQLGDFGTMLVLRHVGGVIRLRPYLRSILVDDPNLEWRHSKNNATDVYSMVVGALRASSRESGLVDMPIQRHGCRDSCRCKQQYNKMRDETFAQIFLP